MTNKSNSNISIDTIELCKKIELQISSHSKKNTEESVLLVNEVLRPSLVCIKLNEEILKELAQIGSKHFT
jgi:hypothetical protein